MIATKLAAGTVPKAWMADAACAELPPAVFFPGDDVGVTVAQCVSVACPVRDLCLEYALANRIEHGVWGGASEAERRQMQGQGREAPAVSR